MDMRQYGVWGVLQNEAETGERRIERMYLEEIDRFPLLSAEQEQH